MNLPAKKEFTIPSTLSLLLRPSTKHPEVIVGEVFFSSPSLGLGIGLQVRLQKEAVLAAPDPLGVAAKEGCHAIQNYLHDATVVFQERLLALHQEATPPVPPVVSALRAGNTLIGENARLKADLVALQAKYDQREAEAWGISGV